MAAERRSLPSRNDPANRLVSWKAIARHLGVSVRTAQRWERWERLPTHRHMHATLGSVYAFGSELDAWWDSRPTGGRAALPRGHAVRSLAVLPFADLDRRLETEILADGLTEELINALTHVEGLRVVARTSAFRFKAGEADVRDAGTLLGVDTVLQGSVRQSGTRLRVVARLIDVASGRTSWSEGFERGKSDLFAMQEDIAHAIAGTLRTSTAAGIPPRPARPSPRGSDAYERYLEGRYHWNRRTPAGFLKAVECLERAVADDPGMARAWAALAECYAIAPVSSTMSLEESIDKATEAAQKALRLDSGLGQAHATLGILRAVWAFDWAAAETHFRRALELQPELAFAHLLYGAAVLGPTGRLDEAEAHQVRAAELDPLSPVVVSGTGIMRMMRRQYDEAVAAFDVALSLDPTYPWAHRGLGEVHLLRGQYEDGVRHLAKVEMPALAGGYLGYCHARLGRMDDARQMLRRLEQSGQSPAFYQVAVLHLGLNDPDGSFEWLARAAAHRSVGVQWLKVEPIWDPARSDPRFARVLDTMGLGSPDPGSCDAPSRRRDDLHPPRDRAPKKVATGRARTRASRL